MRLVSALVTKLHTVKGVDFYHFGGTAILVFAKKRRIKVIWVARIKNPYPLPCILKETLL